MDEQKQAKPIRTRLMLLALGVTMIGGVAAGPATLGADSAKASAQVASVESTNQLTASIQLPVDTLNSVWQRKGSHYFLWLNRNETRILAYTTWGGSWIAGKMPWPYNWMIKGYLWLLKSKAKDYYRQGKCMVISWKKYWIWANPVPVFVSYRGGYCR